MDEKTNKMIETFLAEKREVRYDEIDHIMEAVDEVTDFEEPKDNIEVPILKKWFFTNVKIPIWGCALIGAIGFILGILWF